MQLFSGAQRPGVKTHHSEQPPGEEEKSKTVCYLFKCKSMRMDWCRKSLLCFSAGEVCGAGQFLEQKWWDCFGMLCLNCMRIMFTFSFSAWVESEIRWSSKMCLAPVLLIHHFCNLHIVLTMVKSTGPLLHLHTISTKCIIIPNSNCPQQSK